MRVLVCDSTVSQEVVHAPLFHPTGASQVLACVCISVGVCESEREVYLCLLKGVRVSTASHWAPLYSQLMWATACQAVCVRVCTQWCACLWLREGEKLPSASVSVTAQGNRGSWKFSACCHECCKVWCGWSSSQSQGGFGSRGIQEMVNQYWSWVMSCRVNKKGTIVGTIIYLLQDTTAKTHCYTDGDTESHV